MTLWHRIAQGTTAFSLGTGVNLVAGVLAAKFVFHYLSPAVYGQLALFLSFYATGTIFLSFGLGEVLTAEIARARGAGEQGWVKFLIGRYLVFLLTTATLLLGLFVGLGLWHGEPLLWSMMGVYLWLTAPNRAAYTLLHGTTRYRRLAGQSITRSLTRLGLLATLPWWWPGAPLLGVTLTYPLMELAVMLVSLLLARGIWVDLQGVSTTGYRYQDLLHLFYQQGMYATLSLPFKSIRDQLPVWLLKVLADDATVGIYAAAQRAYLLIFAFFRSLETTLFPLVAEQIEGAREQLRVGLRQAQKYSFWLGMATATIGTLTAPWIIGAIAGAQYQAAIQPFRLLLWLLVPYAFIQVQRPLLYALKQQKWLFFSYVFQDLLYALLLWYGIRWMGVTGAVWARLLTMAAVLTAGLCVLAHLSPQLWTSPLSVFKIDTFDHKLIQLISEKICNPFLFPRKK
jgi:O-antigen/teichoic acid export membrane protein